MTATRRTFLEWTGSLAALAAAGSLTASAASCGGSQQGSSGGTTPPDTTPPGAGPGATPAGNEQAGAGAQKARVLILGGTGFLGPHLVEAARARGHQITLFNRGKTNPDMFPDLEKLRGDRDGNLDALRNRTWDAVIDTSGYVPRLVRASAELLAPAIKHYVFISSISVYADFARQDITEEYPVGTIEDPTSEDVRAHYGPLKALCEQAAETAMPGRVSNIRPGLIVGPRDGTDRFTYWPVRVARGGEVLAPGKSEHVTQYIDVRDLAEWTITVIEKGHMGVYNAVGPDQPISMGTFLQTCKEVTGSDATFTWLPGDFLEDQKIAPWSQMPMWLPPEGEYLGFGSVSNRKAVARGLQFRPVADTVKATLAWFATLPEERRTKLRAGLTAEREAEVLAEWRRQAQ